MFGWPIHPSIHASQPHPYIYFVPLWMMMLFNQRSTYPTWACCLSCWHRILVIMDTEPYLYQINSCFDCKSRSCFTCIPGIFPVLPCRVSNLQQRSCSGTAWHDEEFTGRKNYFFTIGEESTSLGHLCSRLLPVDFVKEIILHLLSGSVNMAFPPWSRSQNWFSGVSDRAQLIDKKTNLSSRLGVAQSSNWSHWYCPCAVVWEKKNVLFSSLCVQIFGYNHAGQRENMSGCKKFNTVATDAIVGWKGCAVCVTIRAHTNA